MKDIYDYLRELAKKDLVEKLEQILVGQICPTSVFENGRFWYKAGTIITAETLKNFPIECYERLHLPPGPQDKLFAAIDQYNLALEALDFDNLKDTLNKIALAYDSTVTSVTLNHKRK